MNELRSTLFVKVRVGLATALSSGNNTFYFSFFHTDIQAAYRIHVNISIVQIGRDLMEAGYQRCRVSSGKLSTIPGNKHISFQSVLLMIFVYI